MNTPTVSPRTWVDGVEVDTIATTDRGLHYGDGLFETISCVDGRVRWWPRHLRRLQLGCSRLGIDFQDSDRLAEEVACVAATLTSCIIKVIVTRGSARERGYGPTGEEQPRRIVSQHEWPTPPPWHRTGLRLGLSSVRLGPNPLLAGLKHLNRLEQVLAQREREPAQYDELLMLSADGRLVSAISANVFLIYDAGICTPELCDCGVAGIMRERVIEAAAAAGVPMSVRAIAPVELDDVRGILLTNVRLGVQAVRWFRRRELQDHRWTRQLKEILDATPD